MNNWLEQDKIEIITLGQDEKKIRTLICIWSTRQLLKKNFKSVSEPPSSKSETLFSLSTRRNHRVPYSTQGIPCGSGGGGGGDNDTRMFHLWDQLLPSSRSSPPHSDTHLGSFYFVTVKIKLFLYIEAVWCLEESLELGRPEFSAGFCT